MLKSLTSYIFLVNLSAVVSAYEIQSECDLYTASLSSTIGSTFGCFSKYSQPASLCGQCRDYTELLIRKLNDKTSKSAYGIPCSTYIKLASSLEPWPTILSNIMDIWENSHCSQCLVYPFNFIDDPMEFPLTAAVDKTNKDTVSDYNYASYSNDTLEYFVQLNNTVACISNFIANTTTSFLDIANFPPVNEVNFNFSVCQVCSAEYHKLNVVYKQWAASRYQDETKTHWYLPKDLYTFPYYGLCSDVADALNRTQWVWFHMLNCSVNVASIRPVVALAPLIMCALLCIIFHAVMMCLCHRPTHVMIYKQSRVEAARRLQPVFLSNENTVIDSDESTNAMNSTTSDIRCPIPRNSLSMLFQQRRISSANYNLSYSPPCASHYEAAC